MSNSNTNLQTQSSNALHNAIMEAGSKDRPPMLAPDRGKAIVTTSAPTYDPEPATVTEDEEMSKEKEIDKLMALISLSFKKIYKPTNNNLRTSSNTSRANQDNSPRINRSTGHDNQRAVNVARARENVGTLVVQKSGIQCYNCKEYGHKDDTDDEPDDQELEAHYMYMAQIREVTPDPVDNSGPIFYDEPMHKDDTDDLDQEHVNKFQEELDKYNDVIYASKVEIDCAKAKGDLMSYKIDFEKSSKAYTRQINDLNQTILDMKKELCAHQETISIMSQAKEAQIKLYKTREDKELDKVIALENKVKVLNDIVYKTGQSVQTMNMLNRNCKMSFAKPEFLKKSQRANPRLYDIGCYNDNLALMLAPESDETIRLDKESRSKLSDLIRPFDYDKLNNLYDLFVPQREKSPEQHYFPRTSKMSHTSSNNEFSKESFRKQTTLLEKRMDESIPWDQKCKSSKELFKIKKSVDTIFDGVERCKQTIAKRTYFGNIDPFIQNTIEGNFCPQIRRINADLEKFHLCLNEEMVADLRYFNSLEHEVDTLKSQLETQKIQFLNEIDRLSREYYYADHMNAILGVYTDLDEVTNLQCDYLETLEKCEHLEKELSKSRTMSKSFEALQKHAINLELDLQQCKEKIKNDKSFKENQSNVFLKEREQYFEIQDLKAQLQDKGIAISELKKLIEKMKGKSVETKFEKSSVIRQPNAFKSQRQSILGKPAIFSDSLAKKDFSKSKPVTTQNVSNDFSKPVTAQILPQNMLPIVKNTNVIAPGMYKVHTKPNQTRTPQLHQDIRKPNKRVSFSTGVIPTTSVSKQQIKSNQLGDRVMSNNSQGKKQEVEDHRRNFKFSNNKTSVTACNDSLNAKTSNVNFVCVTCGKCVLNDNHDLCVLHYINGMNSRTRQPMTLVEIILFIVDSGCSKHMTRNLKLLTNFVEKFLGTVKFGNDQIAPIIGSRGTDLYSITLQDSTTPNPICLMAKATSSQAWLWHHRLSHLNFDTINLLSKNNIVNGLPKLKFVKDHLCSSCELGKAKRKSFHTKTTPSSKRRLQLLHIDLCGPMRVESINGKKYVLVIVDDYSRYTWTHFLRSKDETPGVLIDFLTLVQRGLHAQVTTVRTDKGTKFLNKTLHAYFAKEGIRHETSTARTPEQNGVVERRNRTLVEATRTMLSADKVLLFFWAEAIATSCFTQNRSLVIPRHEKTPYHIINARKPSVKSNFDMSMMGELKFFLGIQIHQSPRGIFINQAKYAQDILKKYGMTSCDSIGTPMATKHLDADLSGTPVDQTKYRSMVGELMYRTASRPDIVHATCYCARYQAKPTEKHLTAVKRIFRYLKDSINMGLWYPKETGGDKLASWSSKKQDCTSMSSAEAESYALSWKPCQGDFCLNLPDHSLESSNNHFKEANNELSKTNQLMFKDLKKFQAELDKYNDVNYASKVEIDCAKAKGDLMSYKIDFEKSSNAYTRKINDLNQTISDMKKELCAHQETISIMSQAKEAQIKL
ncbi:retrovirus-related pol polyprotein from transposon TNT 1-94 [Tanacetum coccineum]